MLPLSLIMLGVGLLVAMQFCKNNSQFFKFENLKKHVFVACDQRILLIDFCVFGARFAFFDAYTRATVMIFTHILESPIYGPCSDIFEKHIQ